MVASTPATLADCRLNFVKFASFRLRNVRLREDDEVGQESWFGAIVGLP
jgi:hypothetical protein